jgi:hypothetical protein
MKKILFFLLISTAAFSQPYNGSLNDSYLVGQSGLTAIVNNILPNAATSADGTDMSGYGAALVQVVSTATAGTYIFEGSNFLNTNYVAINVWNQVGGVGVSAAITATASQIGYYVPKKFRYIRLRIATTLTGGTVQAVTTLMRTDTDPSFPQVQGTVTANLGAGGTAATSLGKAEDGVAASGDTGVPIFAVRRDALTTSAGAAGRYNEIATNRFGAVSVAGFRTNARTYSASANIAVASAATDIAAFFGNATTTVQVTKIRVTGIQTTTGVVDMLLVRRSTANTAGTSSNFSVALHETTDAANSSTPIAYTANPTVGTLAGVVRRWYTVFTSNAGPSSSEYTLEFGENGKPLVLSGVTQGICLNLNGANVSGLVNVSIEWIEF